MERDLVTATLKKKRNKLLKYYQVIRYPLTFALTLIAVYLIGGVHYTRNTHKIVDVVTGGNR